MSAFPKYLFSICILVLATSVSAKASTLQCLMTSNEGWISEQIFVEHDGQSDVARVADGIILHFEKKPKQAQVSEDSAKKLVVNWNIMVEARGRTTKMAYRLAFLKENNAVIVKAKPHGYGNNFIARGTCRPTNQPFPVG